MSTVGLGDFRPYSNFERVLILPFFLFGLLLFSYMNNEMLEITFGVQAQIQDIHDLNGLQVFISTLQKKYNENRTLHNDFENKLLAFFDYKWKNDHCNFLQTENDEEILSSMPKRFQLKILKDFMYPDFYYKFKRLFRLKVDFLNNNINIFMPTEKFNEVFTPS